MLVSLVSPEYLWACLVILVSSEYLWAHLVTSFSSGYLWAIWLPQLVQNSSSSSSSISSTDLSAHFQQPITNQLLFHSFNSIQRKREDRRGWSRSLGSTISTTTTTHHHHYPPTLTDEKVGGGNKGGRTSENSVTLTFILIWKIQTEWLTINITGWLFPLLVWGTPSSSTCGKGPTHLENSKMRRLVKKLNIIMHFFVSFFVFSYIFLYFGFFHT